MKISIPERIQRKRSKGWVTPENTRYVGRGSRFGNPYRVGDKIVTLPDGTTLDYSEGLTNIEAVRLFETYTLPYLDVTELSTAYYLSCWCRIVDKDGNKVSCHADSIISKLSKIQ